MEQQQKTITVTRGNIASGQPGDPCKCAIACALIEAGMEKVHVDYNEALKAGPQPTIDANGKEWSVIPEDRDRVISFIKHFDRRSMLPADVVHDDRGAVMSVSKRAYIVKPIEGGPTVAFICEKDFEDPRRAVWRCTDPSVVLVCCPDCGARPGQLCIFRGRRLSTTHASRRSAVKRHHANVEVSPAVRVDLEKAVGVEVSS